MHKPRRLHPFGRGRKSPLGDSSQRREASGRVVAGLIAAALALPVASAQAQTPAPKPLTLVFVVDGLRPDSINPTDTPNLYRLTQEGTLFTNNHSIVPTVTRGNATGIGSGQLPQHSGILGNAMFVPGVNPLASFSTGDAAQLLK